MDEEVRKILENHEKRLSELETFLKSNPEPLQKRLSPKEFILAAKPKDDVQKTLVLAYYLEKYGGMTVFNAKDLEHAFREAKEPVPDNINVKVIKNIKKGDIMEAQQKKDNFKAWTLTASGERFVENNLKDRPE